MNKLYNYAPITSTGTGITPPPGASVLSLNGLIGALTLVAGSGITITPLGTNITIAATGGGGGITTIGTYDSQAPSANGLVILSSSLYAQSASATAPGMVNTGTQTFAGTKTFTGTVTTGNFTGTSSGTNTGNVTIGTANGLSLIGQSLSLALSSTSTTGALSSTDWNTFNNKQPAGNYITALTGDATAIGPGSVALTLATVNGNVGSFGNATNVGTFTVNAKGLITAASNTLISIPFSQVTGTLPFSQVTGVVPISQGGTGQTTASAGFDALSPMTTGGDLIYGGASGTGTRLTNGTVGQILTSGGGTAAPTWSSIAVPTSSGPSTLRTFTVVEEDWITQAIAGSYGWLASVSSGTVVMNTANIDATHWGIVALTSGIANGNSALLSIGAGTARVMFGTATVYMESMINLAILSDGANDYFFRLGFLDNHPGLPNNGVWFDYNTVNSVNWLISTAKAGVRTQTNSGSAVIAGWQKIAIKITGTSAEYFVNDVSIGTVATNFPNTVGMSLGFGISKGANGVTSRTLLVDYYSMYASWPSSR